MKMIQRQEQETLKEITVTINSETLFKHLSEYFYKKNSRVFDEFYTLITYCTQLKPLFYNYIQITSINLCYMEDRENVEDITDSLAFSCIYNTFLKLKKEKNWLKNTSQDLLLKFAELLAIETVDTFNFEVDFGDEVWSLNSEFSESNSLLLKFLRVVRRPIIRKKELENKETIVTRIMMYILPAYLTKNIKLQVI